MTDIHDIASNPVRNLWFGCYPIEHMRLLKHMQLFVDVTSEDLPPYHNKSTFRITLPIKDRKAPQENQYAIVLGVVQFIYLYLIQNKPVYIHCRGGHGRSALVAALVLRRLGYPADDALKMVYVAHQKRGTMKSPFRKIGAPQTTEQKKYVKQFNMNIYNNRIIIPNPIKFYSADKKDPYTMIGFGCFSNFWGAKQSNDFKLMIDGVSWPTSEHYYQASKFTDPWYREQIRTATTPTGYHSPALAFMLGNQKTTRYGGEFNDIIRESKKRGVKPRNDWIEYRDHAMNVAVTNKFLQNPGLLLALQVTSNSLIVESTRRDSYWGDGGDGSGKNILGRLLMCLRDTLPVIN